MLLRIIWESTTPLCINYTISHHIVLFGKREAKFDLRSGKKQKFINHKNQSIINLQLKVKNVYMYIYIYIYIYYKN